MTKVRGPARRRRRTADATREGDAMRRGRELLQGLKSFEKGKIVTAREAVQLIHDGDTIATTGFVGIGFPRKHRGGARTALRRIERKGSGRRGPTRGADARVCRRAGRRQGARTQPPRPSRPGQARHRWPLGARAETAGSRRRQSHRGLQPAAGRDHPPLSRHRRRQARASVAHRPRHLRRSATRRRQDQRTHDRRRRRADDDRRARSTCSTRRSRSMSGSCAARPPIRTATSRWNARR